MTELPHATSRQTQFFAAFAAASTLLAACVSGPAPKPVTLGNGKPGYVVACNGTDRTWLDCDKSAAGTCFAGFDTFDKEEFANATHIWRNLYFRCK
jgi:hypothetical protein